ncbi:MAG: GNAT family N-acetyltransferase [Dehalococcoidia bacterium]|nr:GNAT family N-acetyltransferase [Dehalococcoidia bacterium]
MSQRYEIPIEQDLAEELFAFWKDIFGSEDPDIPIGVFLGDEVDHSRLITFLERDGDTLTGTCGITISQANPRLAGFGEVATRPDYRGRGIASRLCGQAVEEFVAQGGEAVFLGTGNPDAARIYHRLGWRRIAGSYVWANVTTGDSPEEYLADYYRVTGQVNIVPGDASLRVPMIPLLLTPHDWQVLDGNLPVPMISIRYAMQSSCMGLCRKYYDLVKRDGTAWFAAKTDDDRLVGIATARTDDANVCNVDGFIHARFRDSYDVLIGAAIEWARSQDAARVATRLSVEDEDKQAAFESLGFRKGNVDRTFTLDDREVAAVAMSLE